MACLPDRPRVIAIVGPNACGKSEAAIALAGRFHGEIISADSRQVYRGMDIGSGKVEGVPCRDDAVTIEARGKTFHVVPRLSGGIAHWLLDIVEPSELFTVAEYLDLADFLISSIAFRDRVPFLVGGTGLYIRAVLEGFQFPPATPGGEGDYGRSTLEDLQKRLLTLDPEAAAIIDVKNRRRIIRALEVLRLGGSIGSLRCTRPVFFEALTIGIALPREVVRARILERLSRRLSGGMIEEVESLMAGGVARERLEAFGLEYRYVARYLSGALSFEAMKEKLYTEICRFAKRQMTWFRKYGSVRWISDWSEAGAIVSDFLEEGALPADQKSSR
ncbi:MAG: tRNA (adenosine(37)-N6)-dimethylallyltransferase MiaA [Candidatus Eremiobacteraeota bacterium]|nr:tRNA (adenosine(37)-N6)-dimethylallyltransferase MiaA [Candidatus Eremiobacteraeota bacterium]